MSLIKPQLRLDASESVWFERQLESIDSRVFEQKFTALKARQFVPTVPGISESDAVYTWRELSRTGSAEVIATGAEDLPTVDQSASENTKVIKWLGNWYGWSVMELKAMMARRTSLSTEKAIAARRAIETKMDEILSTGLSTHNLEGILNLTGAASYTLVTKAATGVNWGTIGAPNATAQEIVQDLMGIAAARVAATDGVFDRFRILLPIAQYNLAAQLPMGSDATLTPLRFVMANSPFIADIQPWARCAGAGAGATNRMVCYHPSEEVLGGIVPNEFEPFAPQLHGMQYRVYNIAATGGVVLRYPAGIAYADGL